MVARIMIGLKPGTDPGPLLDLAISVASRDATLVLVSLVPVGTQDDEPQRLEDVRAGLEKQADALREQGYRPEVHAQINAVAPGAELARTAGHQNADLLVIGLGKRSRVGKALLGSDAQSALLGAPCPVLCGRFD